MLETRSSTIPFLYEMIVTGDSCFVLISKIKNWDIKQSKKKKLSRECPSAWFVPFRGLQHSSCMTHAENGNIHMPNGMRLPMSEDKCRNSSYPQDEGATVLAHPWAIWAHKCTIAHRLGNSALMHKSSTDCLRHDLKGLLEKRWLVYVPHTVDSYLWYYEWGWGITACLW